MGGEPDPVPVTLQGGTIRDEWLDVTSAPNHVNDDIETRDRCLRGRENVLGSLGWRGWGREEITKLGRIG